MSIATFSLPIDIPWKRIAFSLDMMDPQACDRELPLRWRSSVAVFEYEPPADQQRTDGFITSYLKVSCTITGYQEDGKEIRIRERIAQSGWDHKDMTDRLTEHASKYYPCYGAILEVVVAPHPDDKKFTMDNYPYFADFDPKKRELFEVVTDTGETMSRSLEDVNVRLGQTTLQSHEVMDQTTLGAGLSASYMGISASGSVSNQSGTTDLSQQGTENIRTSDAAREARETFSHTTQLSQMYHQLDSYHLGTNRASFFILPRPHVVQSPATFVNGPRQIEGIQEFMLVVVRPKDMELYCVEAYLETAHLTGKPVLDWGSQTVMLPLKVDSPDNTVRTNSAVTPMQAGFVIDRGRGPQGVPLGGIPHGDTGGYELKWVNEDNIPRKEKSVTSDYTFFVTENQVAVNGWVEGWPGRGGRDTSPGSLDLGATVYLKKAIPVIVGIEPGLIITGREICSCNKRLTIDVNKVPPSIVYEKSLGKPDTQSKTEQGTMSIREANQLGADIKHELLQSLSSPDRYPRGTVSLLETQLVTDMMAAFIRHADPEINTPLKESAGVNPRLVSRVTAYAPSITRSQLLEMPLPRQVENFGLSFAEAIELRRALTDLVAPAGQPPKPKRQEVQVPLLAGLGSYEGRALLSAGGLTTGTITIVDSPLPTDSIIGSEPKAGTKVVKGSEVAIRVASGLSVRLPEILNLRLSAALGRLRETGLKSEPTVLGKADPNSEVVELEPQAGTLVTPYTPVTIRLQKPPGNNKKQSGRTEYQKKR